jgi:5-formyltetrahydrofolate cyclo-ligase
VGDVGRRKQQLRDELLAARRRMADPARAGAGDALTERGLAQWRGLAVIAAYLSVGTEPPTRALVDGLAAGGTRVLLPVVTGDELRWTPYDGLERTVTGPLGLVEPVGESAGDEALLTAQLVIVPALAVDRRGNRIGRGRGYYDRALPAVTVPVIAVVFDAELLDDVPAERHDRPVDGVLQPSGFTSWSPRTTS